MRQVAQLSHGDSTIAIWEHADQFTVELTAGRTHAMLSREAHLSHAEAFKQVALLLLRMVADLPASEQQRAAQQFYAYQLSL